MKCTYLLLFFFLTFSPIAYGVINAENINEFKVLRGDSEASVDVELKDENGTISRLTLDLVEDKYKELTKFSTNKANSSAWQLWVFHDLEVTISKSLSTKNTNSSQSDIESLWVKPEILQFDLSILNDNLNSLNFIAHVVVKARGQEIASGFVRAKHTLKVKENTYIDGNQTLGQVLILDNQLGTLRRYVDMDFEIRRDKETQRFWIRLDLNNIKFSSRLSKQNEQNESEPYEESKEEIKGITL